MLISYRNEAGNIIFLILIAVALFGALTFTLTKSIQSGGSTELDEARIKQYASEILSYASDADSVITQMGFNGSDISEVDPILPSDVNFEAGSDIHKLFHIDGGGLNYKAAKEPPFLMVSPAPTTQSAWVVSNDTNVEWTSTTADDIILTAFGIEEAVCAKINKIITGSTTIPSLVGGSPATLDSLWAEDGGGVDFNATACGAWEGNSAVFVSNSTSNRWAFYSIVGGN